MSRITAFGYLPGPEIYPPDCLYLDASLPAESAVELSQLGIDTITAEDVGLTRASVTEQLTHATSANRMFVTRVLPLTLYWGKAHAGVLVVSKSVTVEDLIRHVAYRLPLLPFPKGMEVKSVPPLQDFFTSLHRTGDERLNVIARRPWMPPDSFDY